MKKIIILIIVVLTFSIATFAQKVDLTKSEIIEAHPEPKSNEFVVQIQFKTVPDSTGITETIQELGNVTFDRCDVNNVANFDTPASPDADRLTYTCRFSFNKLNNIKVLEIKPHYTQPVLQTTAALNSMILRTAISIPVAKIEVKINSDDIKWYKGDSFVWIPVYVSDLTSLKLKLECNIGGAQVPIGETPSIGLPLGTTSVKINFTSIPPPINSPCSVSTVSGDSLKNFLSFSFINKDNQPLAPISWTAKNSDVFIIKTKESKGLTNEKVVIIPSYGERKLMFATSRDTKLKMFIDDETAPIAQDTSEVQNRELTIPASSIEKLASQKDIPHKIRLEGESANFVPIKEEFPLIITILPRIVSSKVSFNNNGELVIDYELSGNVDSKIRFPNYIKKAEYSVDCPAGKCSITFKKSETDAILDDISKNLDQTGKKQDTIIIEIRAKQNDEFLSQIKVDAAKRGITKEQLEKLQTIENEVNGKNLNDSQIATYREKIKTDVLGCNPTVPCAENEAIDYIITRLRKDPKGSSNKFASILKFGAKVALAYFGLPIPM